MATVQSEISCCGIMEFNGVSRVDLQTLVDEALNAEYDGLEAGEEPAFLFFSDIAQNNKPGVANSGWKIARQITAKKLGAVKVIGTKKNPNSGNMLTMWVWTPDWAKVRKMVPCDKCGK